MGLVKEVFVESFEKINEGIDASIAEAKRIMPLEAGKNSRANVIRALIDDCVFKLAAFCTLAGNKASSSSDLIASIVVEASTFISLADAYMDECDRTKEIQKKEGNSNG